ncbi:STAS domain-containing protein [Streptomyces sp. NPDC058735]|uniref:STAS domain-containing protein n=1 Tax=unclassified Streptomyces TaxID=2593676 RepID=UPI00368FABEE
MTSPLTLSPARRADGTAVLTVVGEIDQSNAHELAKALDEVRGTVVLDLTGVEYLDSAGLNVLFARSAGLELVVPPLLAPVLTVSGLAALVPVHQPEHAARDTPAG